MMAGRKFETAILHRCLIDADEHRDKQIGIGSPAGLGIFAPLQFASFAYANGLPADAMLGGRANREQASGRLSTECRPKDLKPRQGNGKKIPFRWPMPPRGYRAFARWLKWWYLSEKVSK